MIFIDLWLLCNHGLWHVTQCAFLVKTGKGIVHCPEGMYSVCVCVCRVLKGKRLIWGLRWEEEDTEKCEREKALWNELLFVSSMLVEDCQSYWLFFFFKPTQCCSSFSQSKLHLYFDSGLLWFLLSFFSIWWGFLDLINISIQHFCNCMQ